MKYLVTAEEMKRCDSNMINNIKLPSLVLMERAALALCDEIKELTVSHTVKTVFIMAGTGNNGGDGLALARLLCDEGFMVSVCIVGDEDKATEQWRLEREILSAYPVSFISNLDALEYNVYVDALFGVGLKRPVEGIYAALINACNERDGIKLAVDVPSGISSDDGRVMGCAFKADITVTFAFAKRGLFMKPGCDYSGRVRIAGVGITEAGFEGIMPGMFCYDEPLSELLPRRDSFGNKGSFGKALLISGSVNMAGAAVLSARACYRAGAGMVKVLSSAENRIIIQSSVPEALFGTYDDIGRSEEWADVIAAGPGLGLDRAAAQILDKAVNGSKKPLILDADALKLLAADVGMRYKLAAQGREGRTIILTPHVGELSILTGVSIGELKGELWKYAGALSAELNAVVAAKDAITYTCAPGKIICANLRGTSGMATAGSGDVLTGCVAGLLAQGADGFEAASVGVYAAALAGEAAAAAKSEYAMTAMDIADNLMCM
ncbi:MAG: NAD(P)H-hydrate dehydratase [Lachnospiraceae bacterium]|nr:NAD(P)H-hydrate dehydratase [Lachnospiraceae bacterium]